MSGKPGKKSSAPLSRLPDTPIFATFDALRHQKTRRPVYFPSPRG
jgi:hypothetical protein